MEFLYLLSAASSDGDAVILLFLGLPVIAFLMFALWRGAGRKYQYNPETHDWIAVDEEEEN